MKELPALSLNRRSLIAAIATLPALTAAGAAHAQSGRSVGLSENERALVQRAQEYLEALGSVQGRFAETGPRGQRASGAFYLRRPGRMRFEYDAPSRLVVTADGTWIYRWDPRLETHQRLAINQTPLSLLLGERASFSNRYVRIDRVVPTTDGAAITVRDTRRAREGALTLVFGGAPYRLREWTVTDAQGGTTRAQLLTLQPASGLGDNLFRDPRRS